jgi:hypothetical protein
VNKPSSDMLMSNVTVLIWLRRPRPASIARLADHEGRVVSLR